MHLEGSLGWEHDKWITGGVFAEYSTIDKRRDTNNKDKDGNPIGTGGKYSYKRVDSIEKKTTFMNVGLGIRGNTSKFMHSLLESGDTLTYGLAYVYKNAKNSRSLDTDENVIYKDEIRNQITAGIGYQAASGMTLELNWMTEKSNNKKLFKDDNGKVGQKDIRHQAYLKATYEF